VLELFQKLINEHGSSTILKERLGFLQAQYAALETRCRDLEAENAALRAQLEQVQTQAQEVQRVAGKAVFCSHCGSSNLKRTGSRPDSIFGDVGIDRIHFMCNDCRQASDFLNQ